MHLGPLRLTDECDTRAAARPVPRSRRLGIAQDLLRAAIEETRRRARSSLVLEVATDNDAACSLYAGFGFIAVGRRARYYKRPDGRADAMIMRLTLTV